VEVAAMNAALDIDRIVSEYEGRVVRYLTGLVRDPALAQDLGQETFLRVHRNLPQLHSADALTAWIFRIASHLAVDHLRSRAAREDGRTVSLEGEFLDEDADPGVPAGELSAEGRLEQEEMAACVRGYIDHLPPGLSACLILRDIEGLDEKTVADVLGCSVGAVKVRTHRARGKLREALRRGCDFYQDEAGVLRCEPAPSSNENASNQPVSPRRPCKE
jgi:RNA polymerase sigma-70 factor (ECF subfamily)